MAIDPRLQERLRRFVSDEAALIEQLRTFVGVALAPRLDGDPDSLATLDAFLNKLTEDPEWARSPLFEEIADDMETWLTLRIAYYLGLVLRRRFGCEWNLSEDSRSPVKGTPVMHISGVELSPLEIAWARLNGEVSGGLKQLLEDLEEHLLRTATSGDWNSH